MIDVSGSQRWKRGRGKLGILEPLLGKWRAEVSSDMGEVVCVRELRKVLENTYVRLTADWTIGQKTYSELALIGIGPDKRIAFWSFTSDGKHSTGLHADVSDVHDEAIGFEAKMPAGLARMIYWPHEDSGFCWAVESQTRKGWNRFTEHHYVRIE